MNVYDVRIMAKRCVLEQKLLGLLTVYVGLYEESTEMNDLDLCIGLEVV